MIRVACFFLTLLAFAPTAIAQGWPSRQITIVVPFPAGALSDAAARILQPRLSEALGQPVVIENKGGAGGVIGSTFVARSQPDGYTLLVTVNAPIVMAPALQKSYPFDPLKALAGVSLLTETYLALAVRSDSPIKSIADVVRLARERPLTFGSAGVGSAHQIAGSLLNAKAGISINHVPFQGGGPAVQALAGGHIDMSFATLPSLTALVKDGQLRLVALAEPKRYAGMPGPSDDQRDGCGRRDHVLGRHVRARRNSKGRAGKTLWCGQRGAADARCARQDARTWHGPGAEGAG